MPIKMNPGHFSKAVVVDLPDENGRVKVRVPEFHGPCIKGTNGFPDKYYVDDEDLPLADVSSPLGLTDIAVGINEIVYVTFPDCKLDMPLITGTTGSFMSEDSTGKTTEYSEGYLTVQDSSGNGNLIWTGGTGSGSTMVSRAKSLVGSNYVGPTTWWGYGGHWCAMFVSYVAHLVGYIGKDATVSWDKKAFGSDGIIPKHASCTAGAMAFADKDLWVWAATGYTPRPGDIIYFDWGGGRNSRSFKALDHVAIVEKVEKGYVHTIGGNENGSGSGSSFWHSSKVRDTGCYAVTSSSIMGYGTPKYPTQVTVSKSETRTDQES